MRQLAFILCGCLWATSALADGPKVAVTLKPLHSLAAWLLEGISTPQLIIRGGISPHRYAPRPSEVRTLHDSDLIIWVGEMVEPGLAKTIQALGSDVRVVTLSQQSVLNLLPARAAGSFTPEDKPSLGNDLGHGHDHEASLDPHFWLDPDRAKAAAYVIAQALIEIDPQNAAAYKLNFSNLSKDLKALDKELKASFATLGGKPFFVFHDAYQYLEQRYGLRVLGAVVASADRAPGAKRLTTIRDHLKREKVSCVLYEPQFKPALVNVLVEDLGTTQGPLDPLGAGIPPGRDHYFSMMRETARSISACVLGNLAASPS